MQATFTLTNSNGPVFFGFSSPNGVHLIEGMPGNLSFSVGIKWNGSPGSATFGIDGTSYPAVLTDLGSGQASAALTIPAPATISAACELTVTAVNGEGYSAATQPGVYFYPLPGIIVSWFGNGILWQMSGAKLSFAPPELTATVWTQAIPSGVYSTKATMGVTSDLTYDSNAGVFSGSISGTGGFDEEIGIADMTNEGDGELEFSGKVQVAMAGLGQPMVTPSWEFKATGKAGIGGPVADVIGVIFPPLEPGIQELLENPWLGPALKALQLKVFLIGGLGISGEYVPGQSETCFLGSSSIGGSETLGLEGEVPFDLKGLGIPAEFSVYAGGSGTLDIGICPALVFNDAKVDVYAGYKASGFGLEIAPKAVGLEIDFHSDGKTTIQSLVKPRMKGVSEGWRPISERMVYWGPANCLALRNTHSKGAGRAEDGGASNEQTIVQNVTPVGSPAVLADAAGTTVLFSMNDPSQPWYTGTSIGTAQMAKGGGWTLGTATHIPSSDYCPRLISDGTNLALAAWVRVAGDVSGVTNPVQVLPHTEIATAWLDRATGLWTPPVLLTTNDMVDRDPHPIAFGSTVGIIWVQNAAGDAPGNSTNGDTIVFAEWNGAGWGAPQTLWSYPGGITGVAFTADGDGEAHVVFAVDEDGDLNTSTDRELYEVFTVEGVWQAARQLTDDQVEDSLPTLVAPNGVPICVWSAGGTLTYTTLNPWNPKPVFSAVTLSTQAPALEAVTLPAGAAAAYAVQGSNGVDIVCSYYDANLDVWSLPVGLTQDDAVESALSLTWDGQQLVPPAENLWI